MPDLLRFKGWLIDNACDVVAMESTGTYWIPVYSVLEDSIEVIVANPYMIKHITQKREEKRGWVGSEKLEKYWKL